MSKEITAGYGELSQKGYVQIFNMERLPAILKKQRMLIGIERYRSIMERVWMVDVSSDEVFQKTYENFYTLGRYPKDFRRDYFAYMERGKMAKPSFEEALRYFLKYGTLEVSFSSKLVHTLDPEQPIWDRNVTERHFGYKIPANATKNREKKMLDRYEQYKRDYLIYMDSPDGKAVIQAFEEAFPKTGFTDLKKLDFVLWLDDGGLMAELFASNERIETVFDLIGDKENDITKSISWVFVKCPRLLEQVIERLIHVSVDADDVVIRYQEFEKDRGITDLEITDNRSFYIIIESKRGWCLPAESQLKLYSERTRFISSPAKVKAIVSMSECTEAYAKKNLPTIPGTTVLHLPWAAICELAGALRAKRYRRSGIHKEPEDILSIGGR